MLAAATGRPGAANGARRRMTSAVAPVREVRDVDPGLAWARGGGDAPVRARAWPRFGGPVASEVGLHSAVASAALEGHGFEVEAVRAGTVTAPVVQGALRVSAALDGLASNWRVAPRQVLAKLHLLAARGSVD